MTSTRSVAFDIFARDRASAVLNDIGSSADRTGEKFNKFGLGVAAALGAATVAGAAFLMKVGAPYVDSLNKIQTLTGATDQRMKSVASTLEDNASLYAKMGMTTGDAAAGVVELAKAGMSLGNSMKAVSATMVLAKAGEMDVAEASSLVSNTLNVFKLKATDAARVANVLANAANVSSADVSDLSQSLAMVSNVAAGSGASIEQTSAMLAELANAGMKGSDAGTSLKTMLLSLQAPSSTASQGLKDLGVSAFDAAGKARPIRDVLGDLDKKFKGLTDQGRAQKLKAIFGADAFRAAKVIFGNGSKALDEYTKSVSKAGAAQRLAESSSRGLAGTLAMIKARAVSYGQALYRAWSPIADDLLRNKLIPALMDTASWMQKNRAVIEPVVSVLAGLAAGAALVGVATKAWAMAQAALNVVLTANPIGLVVVALAGLAAGLVYAYKHSEKFRETVNSVGSAIRVKALPILSKMADIFQNRVMPIVRDAADFFMNDLGPAVMQIAEKVGNNLKPIWEALAQTFQSKILPTLDKALAKFHEWQPTIQKVILVVAKIIGKFAEFQSAVLGKVLPPLIKVVGWIFGKVVPAQMAMWEGFGKIIKSMGFLADAAIWMWNHAMGPSFKLMLNGIGTIVGTWAKMLDAMSHVPGFGWAKSAAESMRNAADKANDIADGIKRIPTRKTVSVTVSYNYTGLKDPTRGLGDDFAPRAFKAAGASAGAAFADGLRKASLSTGFGDAGRDLIRNLIKGIDSQKIPVSTVLDRLHDFIERKMARLGDLLSKRNDVVSSLQGMTESVFSHDFSSGQKDGTPTSVADIIAFQKRERSKAMRLRRDADRVRKLGLSDDLIQQFINSGESGAEALHALAQGSKEQIAQLNRQSQGTKNALTDAGLSLGNELYGDQIAEAKRQEALAKRIEKAIERAIKNANDKNLTILSIDGHQIVTAIKREKKRVGHDLGIA